MEKSLLPVELGYRMPAEWERHEATWLAWPHNPFTWVDLREIETVYAGMIAFLSRGEKVKLLVGNAREEEKARKLLRRSGAKLSEIFFFRIPTHDAWIRDYGPNFIVRRKGASNSRRAVNRWIFNGWGKYRRHAEQDNKVSGWLARSFQIPVFKPGMVLEGGSIDSNGKGTILTTEQCLLRRNRSWNRNPHIVKSLAEARLKNFLGASHIVWLGRGIRGDDTDGHVDNLARFVAPGTVLCAVETDSRHPNHAALQDNLKRLRQAVDQNGKKFCVVKLPMPCGIKTPKVFLRKWPKAPRILPASYANFYIANTCVLVPVFGQACDRAALKILKELFPGRLVAGIPSEALVCGLGGIHCLTHEEPTSKQLLPPAVLP